MKIIILPVLICLFILSCSKTSVNPPDTIFETEEQRQKKVQEKLLTDLNIPVSVLDNIKDIWFTKTDTSSFSIVGGILKNNKGFISKYDLSGKRIFTHEESVTNNLSFSHPVKERLEIVNGVLLVDFAIVDKYKEFNQIGLIKTIALNFDSGLKIADILESNNLFSTTYAPYIETYPSGTLIQHKTEGTKFNLAFINKDRILSWKRESTEFEEQYYKGGFFLGETTYLPLNIISTSPNHLKFINLKDYKLVSNISRDAEFRSDQNVPNSTFQILDCVLVNNNARMTYGHYTRIDIILDPITGTKTTKLDLIAKYYYDFKIIDGSILGHGKLSN